MSISKKANEQIYKLIDVMVTLYISRASKNSIQNSGNPFVMALLEDFEPLLHRIHGLKTSLGSEMEKIAEIIALDSWGVDNVERKVKRTFELPINVFRTIDQIINDLSDAKKHSNYPEEIKKVIEACKNTSKEMGKVTYEFDLQLYDIKKNHLFFLEMKGPDPNTTEVPGAKRRLLSELAWGYFNKKFKSIDALIAIYYNNQFPKPYKNPKVLGYFDPNGGMFVHDKFWNFVGKNEKTYDELLDIFKRYGKENKKRIWTEFSKLIKVK